MRPAARLFTCSNVLFILPAFTKQCEAQASSAIGRCFHTRQVAPFVRLYKNGKAKADQVQKVLNSIKDLNFEPPLQMLLKFYNDVAWSSIGWRRNSEVEAPVFSGRHGVAAACPRAPSSYCAKVTHNVGQFQDRFIKIDDATWGSLVESTAKLIQLSPAPDLAPATMDSGFGLAYLVSRGMPEPEAISVQDATVSKIIMTVVSSKTASPGLKTQLPDIQARFLALAWA